MPSSIIRSVCIVCNVDFECESKQNEKNLPALFTKMWKVFNKYFNLSSSKWKDILHFYNQVFELPYCTNCRNDVAQLLIFHEKIEYNLLKIKKLTTNLSATIIQSSYKSQQENKKGSDSSNSSCGKGNDLDSLVQNDSNHTSSIKKENDNDQYSAVDNNNKPKLIVNEAVNSQIRLLRQQIVQNFEPQVVLSDFYTEKINEEIGVKNYSIISDLDFVHNEVPMNNILNMNNNVNEDFQDDDYNINNNANDDDDEDIKMDQVEEQSRTSTMTMENYCLICDETFVDSCSLAAHSLLFHGINLEMIEVEESKSSEKIVVEEEKEENVNCDSKSIPVVRLSANRFQYANCNFEKNPNAETEYICKCGEKRLNMSSILEHINAAHVGNKAVKLGHGQFSVTSSSTDKQWIFNYTDKGFSCGNCDKVTKAKKNMISHIKVHHMEMPAFACYVKGCDTTFSSAFNARRHISTVHLNIRPFDCDLCNGTNSFKSKKCLIRHMKAVHELSDLEVEAINRKKKRQKSSNSSTSSSSMWTPNEVLVLEEEEEELILPGKEHEGEDEATLMTEMEMTYDYDNNNFNHEFLNFSNGNSKTELLDVCDLDSNNYYEDVKDDADINTCCDDQDPLALQSTIQQ